MPTINVIPGRYYLISDESETYLAYVFTRSDQKGSFYCVLLAVTETLKVRQRKDDDGVQDGRCRSLSQVGREISGQELEAIITSRQDSPLIKRFLELVERRRGAEQK